MHAMLYTSANVTTSSYDWMHDHQMSRFAGGVFTSCLDAIAVGKPSLGCSGLVYLVNAVDTWISLAAALRSDLLN